MNSARGEQTGMAKAGRCFLPSGMVEGPYYSNDMNIYVDI